MFIEKQPYLLGAWLFRWRSYLPLSLIAIIIPAFRGFSYPFDSHTLDLAWELVIVSISVFGLVIRSITIGHTPKNTSGGNTRSQVADTLNTSGMYSITRNPLYLGNFFLILGVTLFVRSWWVPVTFSIAFWWYYQRIILVEESFLKNKFGQAYEEYLGRTPVFFPRFSLWTPNAFTFSLRTVLKREYYAFFGMIAAFSALELIGDWIIEGRIVFDPFYVAAFTVGLVIFVTLRTLKKTTTLLQVEGR